LKAPASFLPPKIFKHTEYELHANTMMATQHKIGPGIDAVATDRCTTSKTAVIFVA
jgi:hypothetical protein